MLSQERMRQLTSLKKGKDPLIISFDKSIELGQLAQEVANNTRVKAGLIAFFTQSKIELGFIPTEK